MIRIIAELRDGGIVRNLCDLYIGPISGAELEATFDFCEVWYGSRPFEIRLEADDETV